jgi:sporulation protein YlmC with PRC-barrel domain
VQGRDFDSVAILRDWRLSNSRTCGTRIKNSERRHGGALPTRRGQDIAYARAPAKPSKRAEGHRLLLRECGSSFATSLFLQEFVMNQKLASQLIVASLSAAALLGCAPGRQQTAQEMGGMPVAGRIPLGVTIEQAELIAPGARASRLVRADVFNEAGERVGRIDDLIVAPDGTVTVAVVDVGGFVGVGARRVAIPVQQFAQIAPRVVLPGASRQSLAQMPEFKYFT